MVKERPILFSAPMVRAILAGTKSQTRRIVKPQPTTLREGARFVLQDSSRSRTERLSRMWHPTLPNGSRTADPSVGPSMLAGDRLWVRETYGEFRRSPGVPVYRADDENALGSSNPWRPSIYMPRAFSRITLEVTGVRLERLQAITEADAKAEGVTHWKCGHPDCEGPQGAGWHYGPRGAYSELWDDINGAGAWDSNPWVWAIDFRRIDQETK